MEMVTEKLDDFLLKFKLELAISCQLKKAQLQKNVQKCDFKIVTPFCFSKVKKSIGCQCEAFISEVLTDICFRSLLHSMVRRIWWSVHLSSQTSVTQDTLLHL